jgi:PncC family amidohydrolase
MPIGWDVVLFRAWRWSPAYLPVARGTAGPHGGAWSEPVRSKRSLPLQKPVALFSSGSVRRVGRMAVEEEIGRLLVERGWHLAVAETSTGGFIGYLLTSVPGSSSYFDRSIVAYSNEAKETSLAVPPPVLQHHGAVSLVTALAMATHVQELSHVEVGLAVTGLTGPRIGRSLKPIGLTYIAIALPWVNIWWEGVIPGERTEIQRQSALKSLEILRDALRR